MRINGILSLGLVAIFSGVLLATDCGVSADEQKFTVNKRSALPYRSKNEFLTQCGLVDDLKHVEYYKDGDGNMKESYVDAHEPSTVQFQWVSAADIQSRLPDHNPGDVGGKRWCTGTLYDDEHVITAGHCFDQQKGGFSWTTPYKNVNGNKAFASEKTIASLMVVHFGYQFNKDTNQLRTPTTFRIAQLVEYRQGAAKLDYAIVKLAKRNGKTAGETFPKAKAKVITSKPAVNDLLAIIQHPKGDPKKVEDGKVYSLNGANLLYSDIDTHGGSSGSGVRNKNGEVLAIHTNGGCMPVQNNTGANRGVLMHAVAKVSNIF